MGNGNGHVRSGMQYYGRLRFGGLGGRSDRRVVTAFAVVWFKGGKARGTSPPGKGILVVEAGG